MNEETFIFSEVKYIKPSSTVAGDFLLEITSVWLGRFQSENDSGLYGLPGEWCGIPKGFLDYCGCKGGSFDGMSTNVRDLGMDLGNGEIG